MSNFRYGKVASVADLDKIISGAIEAAKTMKSRVQLAAIGCMILAAMPGKDKASGKLFSDIAIEKANYLVNELGAGIKGEGLVKFFVYMCGFKVNEAARKEGFVDVANPEWIKKHLEDAKGKAWWDYAPPNAFKGFNLAEELGKVLKRADNAAEQAATDEEKAEKVEIDRDMLDVLHSLISGTPVKHAHALKLVERLMPEQEEAPKVKAA